MDPERKLLLTIDVGERPLALAQRVAHQVVQVGKTTCRRRLVRVKHRVVFGALEAVEQVLLA
jgi:hypothetical protein